jgi:hypothetical protein
VSAGYVGAASDLAAFGSVFVVAVFLVASSGVGWFAVGDYAGPGHVMSSDYVMGPVMADVAEFHCIACVDRVD